MLGRRNLCMLSFIEYIPSTFHILLTPSCTSVALLFQSSGFLAVSVSSILEEEDELVIKSKTPTLFVEQPWLHRKDFIYQSYQ